MEKAILPSLSALRFFAASTIVIHHGIGTNQLPRPALPFDQAVSFFFVLSGFILTYRYEGMSGWRSIKPYLVARFARLWPAHLVTAIAAVLIVPELDWLLLPNLALVHAWIPVPIVYFSYNAVSWTISTEAFFYLAFIFLIVNWRRAWPWKLALCLLLLAAMFASVSFVQPPKFEPGSISSHGLLYISPLARLLEFAVGMVSFLLYRRASKLPRSIALWTALEAASVAFLVWCTVTIPFTRIGLQYLPRGSEEYLGHAGLWPAFPLVILVFAVGRGLLSRLVSNRVLVALGEASYSLYLVHLLVFIVLTRHASMNGFSGLAAGCAISLCLSVILWRYWEMPARQIIKRAADLKPQTGYLKFRWQSPDPKSHGPRQTV